MCVCRPWSLTSTAPWQRSEVGGQMAPLWPTYFDDCRMALFVVDASDAGGVAPAAVELCEMMSHPAMADKPVCVVLTKQVRACAFAGFATLGEQVVHKPSTFNCDPPLGLEQLQ